MLKFQVTQARDAKPFVLRNAYMIGADQNAICGEVVLRDNEIQCRKRETGTTALALQVDAGQCGDLTLQTCLLPEREAPYLLYVELARHRLMVLFNKLEDWGLFDLGDEHPVSKRTSTARHLFVESLCLQKTDPAKAEKKAREALVVGIDATEELVLAHAELLLNKRKQVQAVPRYPLGAGIYPSIGHPHVRDAMKNNYDFLYLPVPWSLLCPDEGDYQWGPVDEWVEWAQKNRMPVIAGPVLSFDKLEVPQWLYMWEDEYQTIRDLAYEHLERVVSRYRQVIGAWKTVSGLHVNNNFRFNFDQLIELTRMSSMLVKKIQPQGRVFIEIREPFGEYHGWNIRSIPPLMYGDLLVQGAVNFDGFSVKLCMGQAVNGMRARDLMQISNLLDQYAGYGKPVHLSIAAPSSEVTELMIASPDAEPADANGGNWRAPWSPIVQKHWMEAMMHIAFSRPYIDSVAWQDTVDHGDIDLPLSGLVDEELKPKPAYKHLANFRDRLKDDSYKFSISGKTEQGRAEVKSAVSAAASEMAQAHATASDRPDDLTPPPPAK